jgi:hypothetical protein
LEQGNGVNLFITNYFVFCAKIYHDNPAEEHRGRGVHEAAHRKNLRVPHVQQFFPQDCALCGEIYSFPACLG